MRTIVAVLVSLFLALGVAACNGRGDVKSDDKKPVDETDKGSDEKSAELALEELTFEFEVKRTEDQRSFILKGTGMVPKGWSSDPNARTLGRMKTLLPPGWEEEKNISALSSFTWSPTCNGMCTQEKLEEQIKAMPDMQVKTVGGNNPTITKREEIGPGVWGAVIETEKGKEKHYVLVVSHWKPGWPEAFLCNVYLQGEYAGAWGQLYDACANLKVELIDPLMTADALKAEEANLAKCPAATTLTYKAEPEREGEPTGFGEVKKVVAYAPRPGSLHVYIANFDMTSAKFKKNPLEGDQRVLELQFSHQDKGEVLSGAYAMVGDQPNRVYLGLKIAEGRTLQWNSHQTEGQIQIVARTPDKVCGTIEIKGGNRGSLTGGFVVDVQMGYAK